jgi:hypothetical protein
MFRYQVASTTYLFASPAKADFAIIVQANGSTIVKGYETESQARRALDHQLNKYDRLGLPAYGQFYPTWFIEEVTA